MAINLSGRALLNNQLDAGYFVDRDQLINVCRRASGQHLNTIIVGARGSGKTSLLHRVEGIMESEGGRPIFIDGRAVEGIHDFLHIMGTRLGVRPTLDPVEQMRKMLIPRTPDTATETLWNSLESIRRAVQDEDPAPTLLVDELPDKASIRTLFGRLRDEVWQLPITWVVASRDSDQGAYLEPPADAFFATVLKLEPLPDQAARELLGRRVPSLEVESVDALIQRARGNPRALIDLAQEIVLEDRDPAVVAADESDRRSVLDTLGDAARALYGELEATGGASASDEDLLRRLGWSRARAYQVVSTLEKAGLVEATTVPGSRGRPRKVYRPKRPYDQVPA